MSYLGNCARHFGTVCKHKFWVQHYCNKAGIPWRGFMHDWSKFSPTEFFESAKYYSGIRSPIDACKEDKGYSEAWLHHKGCNKHHYEYWQDNFNKGTTHLEMPFIYSAEMVCDYLGAGRAYMGKNFSYRAEWEWWCKKCLECKAMHWRQKAFVTYVLWHLKEVGWMPTKAQLYSIYNDPNLIEYITLIEVEERN